MELPCRQKRISSAMAGATVAYYPGLARLVPQLPPMVHYALGGIAIDALCRGRDVMNVNQEVLISGALGIAGAYAAGMFLR